MTLLTRWTADPEFRDDAVLSVVAGLFLVCVGFAWWSA